ncbi:IclR family transcriptional regulator [Dactylosporangium sp. CA-092794]|uniref:IclR family transcriptional regulator n=1 Tax=Dactylosporangium sp. CA-092794 TaxID=3239929 RepID=UPI003D9261F0
MPTDKPLKNPPPYAIASVDHALRLAAMLQLEGSLTVAEAADRLGVARSTAHRLLQMLVYRDFAAQDPGRIYHAGPVLQLAEHSGSQTARLRAASLPHLRRLADALDETVNVTIRTGDTARFIASAESSQALRVGSREGMVFPAHRTTGGILLLAELDDDELAQVYAARAGEAGAERPELGRLRPELARIRRSGFAVNQGRSERGVTAVGVPVRDADGRAIAGLAVSMPSVRYAKERLPLLVAALQQGARGIAADLARPARDD